MIKKTLFLLLLTISLSNISYSQESWVNFKNNNNVRSLAVEGNYLWIATMGGVVRFNINTGEYINYTNVDGLAYNIVYSIAIDSDGNE